MSESIAAVQAVSEATLRQEQWTPPTPPTSPQTADTVRFEANLEAPAESDALPPIDDIAIPESAEKAGQFGEKLMHSVAELDQSYRTIMGRLSDWPSFQNYQQDLSPTAGGDTVTHHGVIESGREQSPDFDAYMNRIIADDTKPAPATVHHSNVQTDEAGAAIEQFADKLEAIRQKNNEFYTAGMEYSRDTTQWYLSTEFWLTKIRILTSAVSQTNQGLTTLFRSGG